MISGLDHVVVLVEDIEAGTRAYELLLGRSPSWRSESEGSKATLFTLANMSLELMAPAGHVPAAEHIRDVIRQSGEGLASICFRVDDIEKMHRRLDRLALQPETIADVESRDVSGATLRWRRTRAATELTRGLRLFFLELAQARKLSAATSDAPVLGLDHVVISTGDPQAATALDRSHPDWGRLMFFRCGDLIVELVQRPGAVADMACDKLWGLSWRVADLEAARARLKAAGIAVSEVRAGRKPGTRVMTVRDGTCGVQTLLLERTARA